MTPGPGIERSHHCAIPAPSSCVPLPTNVRGEERLTSLRTSAQEAAKTQSSLKFGVKLTHCDWVCVTIAKWWTDVSVPKLTKFYHCLNWA